MSVLEDSLKAVDLNTNINNNYNKNNENNYESTSSDTQIKQQASSSSQVGLNDESLDNSNIDYSNESNDHLPRVQVELDKLNYANESINNLELELEDSKREYLKTMLETEEELTSLEKKIGAPVAKAKPYYDARYELNEAKAKYLTAKHRFETAQELYVAAKKMQMYAEENLENYNCNNEHNTSINDRDTLAKILEIAKIKVNETELSKQSSDIEQIEAFKVYDEKRKRIEIMEKDLKKSIDKSKKYFELKANLYKELRFLFTKIEGLKSCLKEAKLTYHQSLKNLELISTEIHTQRQTINMSSSINQNNSDNNIKEIEDSNNNSKTNNDNNNNNNDNNDNNNKDNKLLSTSLSTLSSSSSSSLSLPKSDSTTNQENKIKSAQSASQPIEAQLNDENKNEEDFDSYFNSNINEKMKKDLKLSGSSTPIRTTSSLHLTDEEIDNLKLDEKLKKYKDELDNSYRRKTDDDLQNNKANSSITNPSSNTATNNETSNTSKSNSPTNQSNRPQFRVPSVFSSNLNRK